MTTPPDILAAALAYAEDGFRVFPLKGKIPLTPHGFKDASVEPEVIREWWARHPGANIGIATGEASQVVVLDTDTAEGEAHLVSILGGKGPSTRTHVTGRGRHFLFLYPGVPIPSRAGVRPGLDVRGDGGYIVAPPSVHPETGREYEVADPSVPLAPLPPALLVLLTGGGHGKRSSHRAESAARGSIEVGGRNDHLIRIAGRLRGTGALEGDALLHMLHFYNARDCAPPLEDAEVEGIAASATKWARGDTVVEELNRQYAVVQAGDRVRVLQEHSDGGFSLLAVSEFRTLLSNQTTTDDAGRRRLIADTWLSSPHRRQYRNIVFEPGAANNPGSYNLYKGWAVVPRPGDCSLFLRHLLENICAGNEEHASWVTAWFAHIFQFPAEKPGTALVLRGKQGTGKSICGAIVGRLLGAHYASVATSERVIGRFNAHLERCLLLQAEEAFWGGDRAGEGALKDLVTSHRQFIERKGIDAFEIANYVRLLVTSNAHWVVPAGMEERRFAVLDAGEGRMQDGQFFGDMMKQMNSGGYEALLYHLLHLDISQIDLRRIPKTTALSEQKASSLRSELKWLLDLLTNGALPGDVDGTGVVPATSLHESYIGHARRIGYSRRSSETELGVLLKKFLPGCRRRRTPVRLSDGPPKRVPVYEFPPLGVCRATFSQESGQSFNWPHEEEDWLPSEGPEDKEF